MRVGSGRGHWLTTLLLVVGLMACAPKGPPDNVPTTPPPPAPGAAASLDSARAVRGESLEVAVYTYGPGTEIFERFGHIALAVHDRNTGEDIAFNWGMFDFNEPNFLTRFLTGDTKYWMAGYRTDQFNAAYQSEDRTIRKQVIALTPVQRGALYDYLAWNAQEQNRYYRYDYYRDNCSTRVRDALDWALGGALKPALTAIPGRHTWREETARITASDPAVYAGIEIALGRHADAPLDGWGESFLPERLADHLAGMRLEGAAIVQHDSVLYTAQRTPLATVAPQRLWAGAAIGLLLAGLVVLLARAAMSGSTMASAGLTGFGVLWYVLGGLVGTALLLAATVTKHAPYMGTNMSLLLVHPLLLVTAMVWPWRNGTGRIARAAQSLAVVCAVFAVVALLLLHLRSFWQDSLMVAFAVLPVHAALAWSAWSASRSVVRSRLPR